MVTACTAFCILRVCFESLIGQLCLQQGEPRRAGPLACLLALGLQAEQVGIETQPAETGQMV
jgi:hypothetical protein